MPEIGTSGSMSGEGNGVLANRPQATAPVLDSTLKDMNVMREAVEERAGEPLRAEILMMPSFSKGSCVELGSSDPRSAPP
jgi:hypothetical protein